MNIQNYIFELEKTQNELLNALGSSTLQQLTHKENDKWNILEIIEHILITEKTIVNIISKPSNEHSQSNEIIGKEKLHEVLINSNNKKIATLESLKPKGDILDIILFESAFKIHREALKKDLISGVIIIDDRVFKHPYLGDMAVADWLYFLLYHTQRHLQQILVVLNSSKYMLIIHEVEDYKVWETIFDNAAQIRKEAGEISYQVLSFKNDTNKVVHFSKWCSHEAAKTFFESPELVQIRKNAGVKSPEFIYLNELKYGIL